MTHPHRFPFCAKTAHRLGMQILLWVGSVLACVYQFYFVDGKFSDMMRRRFPSKRPKFKI